MMHRNGLITDDVVRLKDLLKETVDDPRQYLSADALKKLRRYEAMKQSVVTRTHPDTAEPVPVCFHGIVKEGDAVWGVYEFLCPGPTMLRLEHGDRGVIVRDELVIDTLLRLAKEL